METYPLGQLIQSPTRTQELQNLTCPWSHGAQAQGREARAPSLAEHTWSLVPGLGTTVYQGHGLCAGHLEILSPGEG